MGSCLCREKCQIGGQRASCTAMTDTIAEMSESVSKRPRIMEAETIEQLIIEVLRYTGTCQESGGGEPLPLLKLGAMADSEEGWCNVLMGLVNTIPLTDSLGPSAIAVIFDFCPIPARETILKFIRDQQFNTERVARAYFSTETVRREKNLLFILGCIVDKFASHSSVPILTEEMLAYLLTFLVDEECLALILPALVTLEKLAVTAQNKALIEKALARHFLNPLLPLEIHRGLHNYPRRRVSFVARWALDNIFIFNGRKFSFEKAITADINVMLNTKDMTNYLKISADGLEARCDSLSFESVRSTFEMKTGIWYYEVEMITGGVMQIGFATKSTEYESHDGFGIGDDQNSIAYDGCRRLVWHNAQATRVQEPQVRAWRAGDVLGCLADTTRGEIVFSFNGIKLPPFSPEFLTTGEGFYAAASLMVNQQCVFNFGATQFHYPPTDRAYAVMNKHGTLTKHQKIVLPRSVEMEMLLADRKNSVPANDSTCVICYQSESGFGLEPCRHSGFCPLCIMQLTECPMCRGDVHSIFMLAP